MSDNIIPLDENVKKLLLGSLAAPISDVTTGHLARKLLQIAIILIIHPLKQSNSAKLLRYPDLSQTSSNSHTHTHTYIMYVHMRGMCLCVYMYMYMY